jgi:glycosyltransferase involved in cell wall biosynthesis
MGEDSSVFIVAEQQPNKDIHIIHIEETKHKLLTDAIGRIHNLNKIYNSLDVFLSTATGGGWELTVSEAMSCQVPCIIPRHTSFQTLGGANGERAYFLETLYPIVAMVDNIIRFQSDLYEICETLELIYNQKQTNSLEIDNKIEKAYDFVTSLDWKDIAKTFSEDIKRLS